MEPINKSTFKDPLISFWKMQVRHFTSIPISDYIVAFISAIGLISTLLPWAELTIGFYITTLSSGLEFFFGWLIFLTYATMIGLLLLNHIFKVSPSYIIKLPTYGSVVASILSLLFVTFKLFKVSYGAYLCLIVSISLFLIIKYVIPKIFSKKSV